MTTICISSGHGKLVRGASGYIDEVDEARKVVETVAELMRGGGTTVYTFHDNTSTSQNQNLNTIVNYHNSKSRDLDVSVHFNAYQTTSKPMGTEVLFLTQQALADQVSSAISDAGAFIDRGPKKRTDLFFLNSTEMPSILIETCFVDSQTDVDLYHQHYDSICEAIAETISGQDVSDVVPPPERPPQQPPEQPPEPIASEPAVVTIDITAKGNVTLIINGREIPVAGGENMHLPDKAQIQENHTDIETTVFGGSGDPNYSAYDGDLFLNDSDLYVALPWKWQGERPRVKVFNRTTGLSAVGEILDVGPWNIDDDDYVLGDMRPSAETHYEMGEKLPTGPNAGKVPTNAAGLDLSPALARAVGISGKGRCDWMFVSGGVA
jgi:N-acetylmuramoyl-L-alanine amidase